MLASIKLCSYIQTHGTSSSDQSAESDKTSLWWKKCLFVISILSTCSLLFFFAKHRFYCHDLAFSWFALSEYIIAGANLTFHLTTMWDFNGSHLLIAKGGDKLKLNQLKELKLD